MTAETAARRALEALPHGVLVADAAGRLVFANAALWQAAGADPARFPPGTAMRDVFRMLAFRGLLGPGDPAALAATAGAADRTLPQRRHQRTADGSRTHELATFPLEDGGFVLFALDITAFHRAEAAARDRAALLERALTAQAGGIALFDEAERLLLHNPAYRRHAGATEEMLAGRPTLRGILEAQQRAGEFLSPQDAAYLRGAIDADRRQPRMAERERADGRVVRFVSSPQPDAGFLIETADVTDLRRAEDDARRRAAILDGVLQALPHGICVYGADRRVAMFNAAYTRLMEGAPLTIGDTLAEVIGRRAAAGEYGPGEAAAVYAREMARDLSRPQERRRRRANGTALDVRTAPLPDGGHISVVTDVTALWRAEEEARHRASLLETAMASLRHGLVVYGPDRRVVAHNDLAGRLAGHAEGDIRLGRSLDELVRSLHAGGGLGPEPEATRLAEAALALDRTRPHRTLRETPAGRVLEVSSDPTPDGGFVVTHVDITALARTQAEAERRATILDVMLENMRHGICLFDAEGRVVAANALAAAMTGLPPGGLRPGRHIIDLREEQARAGEFGDAEEAVRLLALRAEDPLRAPFRYVRRRPNGAIIEVTTDRTPDGGVVRTYADVTEEHRVRGELERARAAAEAASEAKSRFLATMSHELRTPLATVIGFAEAVPTAASAAELADHAAAIRDAGRHVLSLIDDILDVARAGGPEERQDGAATDAAALAAEVAAGMTEAAAAAGLSLVVDAAAGLPRVRCDARRLSRILRALLDNAIKFTPADGRIRLAVLPDGAGGIEFRLSDTGIGMSEDEIPRAFEPFTQLDASHARRYGGSGLGLHLSRLLAAAMGASLTLESHPGAGTTATLRLPRDITISADVPEETT